MKKLIALLTFAILCLTAAIAEEAPIPDFLPFESAAPEEIRYNKLRKKE